MKALVLKAKEHLTYKIDYPEPTSLKDREVLIKVKYCGICGSDLEAYQHGKVLMPIILGHEFAGDIVKLGPGVEGWAIGDRVTAYPSQFCGKCFYCQQGQENLCKNIINGLGITINGALAEYVKIPANYICKLPKELSYQEGAVVEPLSVGYHGVNLSGIQPADTAVVLGAGTIGLSTIQALKLRGIKEIYVIEPNAFNRNIALQLGAKEIIRPNRLNKIGPDFVFDCAGFPVTYKKDINIVRNGGTVVLLGIHFELTPISFLQLITKEVNLKGSFGYTFQEFKTIIKLLLQGKIHPESMITKIVPLSNIIKEGFQALLHPDRQAVKILAKI